SSARRRETSPASSGHQLTRTLSRVHDLTVSRLPSAGAVAVGRSNGDRVLRAAGKPALPTRTPSRKGSAALSCARRSDDTDARKATVARFGRSHRRAQRLWQGRRALTG